MYCRSKIENSEKQINATNTFLQSIQNIIIENNLLSKEEFSKDCKQEDRLAACEKIIKENLLLHKKTAPCEESNSSARFVELCKQIESLQGSNKCLTFELEELKSIVRQSETIDFDQVKLKLEIANLTAKLNQSDSKYEQLIQKYSRNRKVWQENEQNLTEEIGKLDNFIAVIIDTLRKLPDNLRNSSELCELVAVIDQNEADKSTTNKL